MIKLNSMRILEQRGIPHEALEYNSSFHNAEEVAEVLGLPYAMLYKTLVVQVIGNSSQAKSLLVLIPSQDQLNLKKMAAAAGVKKVKMASHADAERLTGLQVGGISPLALMDKNWPVFLDRQATTLPHIVISGGQRGVQIRLPVAPLVSLLRVRIVDVSESKS